MFNKDIITYNQKSEQWRVAWLKATATAERSERSDSGNTKYRRLKETRFLCRKGSFASKD